MTTTDVISPDLKTVLRRLKLSRMLVRIPAKLNADSEDAERGFRASRTQLGA